MARKFEAVQVQNLAKSGRGKTPENVLTVILKSAIELFVFS
jgi:hypothetical protein